MHSNSTDGYKQAILKSNYERFYMKITKEMCICISVIFLPGGLLFLADALFGQNILCGYIAAAAYGLVAACWIYYFVSNNKDTANDALLTTPAALAADVNSSVTTSAEHRANSPKTGADELATKAASAAVPKTDAKDGTQDHARQTKALAQHINLAQAKIEPFDLDDFTSKLLHTADGIAALRLFAQDVKDKRALWDSAQLKRGVDHMQNNLSASAQKTVICDETGQETQLLKLSTLSNNSYLKDESPAKSPQKPSCLAWFLVRELMDSGIFSDKLSLTEMRIVRPQPSNFFYIRTSGKNLTTQALRAVEKAEAALNATLILAEHFQGTEFTQEQAHAVLDTYTNSIAHELARIKPMLGKSQGEVPNTEWVVRRSIAYAVEALRLPYRLHVDFRTNVADGNVALEFDVTDAHVFPDYDFVNHLPHKNSISDKKCLASAYTLRLALLLAGVAFASSDRIEHVWIAARKKQNGSTSCLLSVDFDKARFVTIDFDKLCDTNELQDIYHQFVPEMHISDNMLHPIEQTFSLDETRFCPSKRYDVLLNNNTRLSKEQQRVFGCRHASGLAIEENECLEKLAARVAEKLAREETTGTLSCSDKVQIILECAKNEVDPRITEACRRCARKLIAALIPDNTQAITEELIGGDTLNQIAKQAINACNNEAYQQALDLLTPVYADIEKKGSYRDTQTVKWRYFNNYIDRALYNSKYGRIEYERRRKDRELDKDALLPHTHTAREFMQHEQQMWDSHRVSLMLVPDAYYEMLLGLSVCTAALKDYKKAVTYAYKLVNIAPVDGQAHIQLIKCLIACERYDQARNELTDFMHYAYAPESLALAYYHMARLEMIKNHKLSAQACFACAVHFMPRLVTQLRAELGISQSDTTEHPLSAMDTQELISVLKAYNIPLAPTPEITSFVLEGTKASLDAEVFPVARNFATLLGLLSGDDVMVGIIRSIETRPQEGE